MTLTSRAFQPAEENDRMAEKTKIIRTKRDVCIDPDRDSTAGEVLRVNERDAHILVGDGSAEFATEDDLKKYEAEKAKADKKGKKSEE